jgi:GT2 family glycosyltransferase
VDLSIVIVNYRSWTVLSRCLASLSPLLRDSSAVVEIVVVDNASGDGLFPTFSLAHPGVRFVQNDGNWGFADGCNRGALHARGESLLFLNPDAKDPGGGVVKLLNEARAHPDMAILTARQVDENGRVQKVFDAFPSLGTLFGAVRALLRVAAPSRYPDPRRDRAEFLEVDWVSGSAFFIRRSVFEELGGFCNGFWMYSEDVDLCRRARNAGHRVALAGAATLVHAHGGASRKSSETAALTRSEVVVSRHFYASRHLGPWHASAYHLALAATRFGPATLAALAGVLGFGGSHAIRERAGMARHLARYYREVPSRGWRSLHAREKGTLPFS